MEEKSTHANLLGAGALDVTVSPLSFYRLPPKISPGSVYILRSVGSLTVAKKNHPQEGQDQK